MDMGMDYLSSIDLRSKNDLYEFRNINNVVANKARVTSKVPSSTTMENYEQNHMEILVDSFSPKEESRGNTTQFPKSPEKG